MRARQTDKDGNVTSQITDPQTLYESVRKHIGDMMSKSNLANPAGKFAASQLMDVQNTLDGVIDKAAPGFKNYMDNYAQASHNIDAMNFMQGLNLKDTNGNITLAKVNKAVDNIDKMRAAPGINPAKHLSTDQYQALKNVQEDLQRDSIMSKSMPLGSPTEQNRKASVKLNGILPSNGDPMSGKITPETAGAAAGTLIGHAVGHPGVGMAVGDALGRMGATKTAARRAAVENQLGMTLADPTRYSPSSLRYGSAPANGASALTSRVPHITIMKNALTSGQQ